MGQDNRQNGERDQQKETILAFSSPDRLEGLVMTAQRKKTEQCENKTKQKKRGEKEGLRRDKDIDEEPEIINNESHILSSRQILGPMTLAAPDTRRKARCFGGQGAESPHLYFRGWGSVKKHVDHKKEDKNATL